MPDPGDDVPPFERLFNGCPAHAPEGQAGAPVIAQGTVNTVNFVRKVPCKLNESERRVDAAQGHPAGQATGSRVLQ